MIHLTQIAIRIPEIGMEKPPKVITKGEFTLYWREFKDHYTAWVGGIIMTVVSLLFNVPAWIVWALAAGHGIFGVEG
jgi:hypothetical protein